MIAVKLRVLPSRRATLIKTGGTVRTGPDFGTRARAAILGWARVLSPERRTDKYPSGGARSVVDESGETRAAAVAAKVAEPGFGA
jgi:hypothetical protein